MYQNLDYTHPFPDGNSRTLRVFTKQFAARFGYQLDWARFNLNQTTRDSLYIARDVAVNNIAIKYSGNQYEKNMLRQQNSQFESNKTLHDVFKEITSPIKEITREISKGKERGGFER